MTFKKLAALFALTAISSIASAGGFDGIFVQAGIGYANSETKISGTNTLLDGSASQSSFVGQIATGYSHAFGAFNLAGNAFYFIGDQDAGKRQYTNGAASVSIDAKGSNTWGLSIEPGWNINESALLYAKLGYVQTSGEETIRANIPGVTANQNLSETYHGFLYGAGGKYKFTENIYGYAEIQQSNFNEKRHVDPSSFTATIGAGFCF